MADRNYPDVRERLQRRVVVTLQTWPEPPDAVEGYLIRSGCNHFDADQNREVRLLQIAFDLLTAREVAVTAHTLMLLTPEEFTSLIELRLRRRTPIYRPLISQNWLPLATLR